MKGLIDNIIETILFGPFEIIEHTGWRALMNFLLIYVCGITFIIMGVTSTMNSLSQMNIGWAEFNMGGIIGAVVNVAIAALGSAWIMYLSNYKYEKK